MLSVSITALTEWVARLACRRGRAAIGDDASWVISSILSGTFLLTGFYTWQRGLLEGPQHRPRHTGRNVYVADTESLGVALMNWASPSGRFIT